MHKGGGGRDKLTRREGDAQRVNTPPRSAAAQSSQEMAPASSNAAAAAQGTKRKRGDTGASEEATVFRTRGELLRALLGRRCERAIDSVNVGFVHGEPANRDVGR